MGRSSAEATAPRAVPSARAAPGTERAFVAVWRVVFRAAERVLRAAFFAVCAAPVRLTS